MISSGWVVTGHGKAFGYGFQVNGDVTLTSMKAPCGTQDTGKIVVMAMYGLKATGDNPTKLKKKTCSDAGLFYWPFKSGLKGYF